MFWLRLLAVLTLAGAVPPLAWAAPNGTVVVAQGVVQGEIFAVSDTCTHRGGPLSEGELEGTTVTCPWHGAEFDVRTGGVLGPPAATGVKSYPVRVTGKDIAIEI
jgi:nitrite reductase/ring-hydroxylating ferredoxin subunit